MLAAARTFWRCHVVEWYLYVLLLANHARNLSSNCKILDRGIRKDVFTRRTRVHYAGGHGRPPTHATHIRTVQCQWKAVMKDCHSLIRPIYFTLTH